MAIDLKMFNPHTADKVSRLFDLLTEINRHPQLAGKLCMHGGTAINLFLLDIPRLSVDIDMSYIGQSGREEMLADRPSVEAAIEEVGSFLGYNVTSGKGDHAGRTFRFRYRGSTGADYVEIDMIYLNRVPLLKPQQMTSEFRSSVPVTVFAAPELIGGKVKAFYDRVKVRDLFDIANLNAYMKELIAGGIYTEDICHKLMLFHAAISKRFPQQLANRASISFIGREDEVIEQLDPMLQDGRRANLDDLIAGGDEFVERFVLPQTDKEEEFLSRFAKADYAPELLFEGNILDNARANPEALWKLANLRKM